MIFGTGKAGRLAGFNICVSRFLLNAVLFFICVYAFMFVSRMYSEVLEENSKNLLNDAKNLIANNAIFENYLREEVASIQAMSRYGVVEDIRYRYLAEKSEVFIESVGLETDVYPKKKLNFELTDDMLDEWANQFEREQRIKLAYEKHMAARRVAGREKIKRAVAISARAKWFRFGWVF